MPSSTEKSAGDRPLISNSSILIFSGFLIGMTVAKWIDDDLAPYVLTCGLSGFLAFIALDLLRERREDEGRQAIEADAARRLQKHTEMPVAPPLPLAYDGDPVEEFFRATGLSERVAARAR